MAIPCLRQGGSVRATTQHSTRVGAGGDSSVRDASASVAPVVMTSSTRAMRAPRTGARTANAPRTFAVAFRPRQRRLRRPGGDPRERRRERQPGAAGDARRDLARLVEAALALARRRERQGDDAIRPVAADPARERGAHGRGERGAGPVASAMPAAVLDALEQSIDRKRIGERGNGAGVRRRVRKAGAAGAVPRRRQRADRARRGNPRAARPRRRRTAGRRRCVATQSSQRCGSSRRSDALQRARAPPARRRSQMILRSHLTRTGPPSTLDADCKRRGRVLGAMHASSAAPLPISP